jgi:outer membrane protein TolC
MGKRYCVLWALTLWHITCFAQNKDLDFYLGNGLNNSPLLHDYQNQLNANTVDSALIRASYRPQVDARTYNTYAPVTKGWGYDEAITNGKNISAVIGVSQTLIGKGNLNTQYEGIRLKNKGIENTAKITEQDLRRSITAQYIQAYSDAQQVTFLNKVLELLRQEDEILKTLTRSNVYRQTDYLTFLVTLQQQELQVKQWTIQFHNDMGTLNYLSGIVDTNHYALAAPVLPLRLLDEAAGSVFLRQYEIDSFNILNKRARIGLNYHPKVNVFGDAGYSSSLLLTPYKNFGYNVGFSIAVPIYDGRQRKMQYNKLSIEEDTRLKYSQFALNQYHQQLAQLHQQLDETSALIEDIEKQVTYSDALIKANARLLSTGEVKIADFIIAINNYLSARNLLTQNLMSRWQIINQINYWNR